MVNYFGKTFYGIERNLFGEIILNGEILRVGQEIIVLRFFPFGEPFESHDTVFYGQLQNSLEEGWQILIHEELPEYSTLLAMRYLYARLPE